MALEAQYSASGGSASDGRSDAMVSFVSIGRTTGRRSGAAGKRGAKRLCALILAHHSPGLLGRVVQRFAQFGVACFVHVDAKVDITPFKDVCEPLGVSFIGDRVDIHWGGFSIVEATLGLLKKALEDGGLSHFLLVSGDTYPVSSGPVFYEYLITGASRIQVEEILPDDPNYARITRIFVPESVDGFLAHNGVDPATKPNVTAKVISRFPDIKRAIALKRRNFPWKLAKGSQWWCLTRPAVDRCLDAIERNREYVQWFRYSYIPDESFLHSLFLNFVTEPVIATPPVFTVWDRNPRPYVFRKAEDFVLLEYCRTVLARKFSDASIPVLDELDAALDSGVRLMERPI